VQALRPGHVSAELLARGNSRRLSGTVVHGPCALPFIGGDVGQPTLLVVRFDKPVSACFEVALLASSKKPSPASLLAEDSLWNANSTDANAIILRAYSRLNIILIVSAFKLSAPPALRSRFALSISSPNGREG
jgi:hypothetical protein